MQNNNVLILEILRQGNKLLMGLYAQEEQVSTIRNYHQTEVSFSEIKKFSQESAFLLQKASISFASRQEQFCELKRTGRLLWDHLLSRSAKERLKGSPLTSLVLSLDEELIFVPWEFLYDGEDFLCLKFSLGRLIRTSGYQQSPCYRSPGSTIKMLILADPTNDLKSAYREGKFIRNQFDRQRKIIKIDFKSSEIETLYVKKNLRDYDIVHFAGHCEFDEKNPKNSGWVLSDGRFTSGDIQSLGESPSLPNLVFSHACQSACFSKRGIETDYQNKTYSLASSFLFAGVRHYLGAIWKIEDTVALSFAKEFYAQLIQGRSIGECVRMGRLALIKEYGHHSLLWTNYLLYGDPEFVFFNHKLKKLQKKNKIKSLFIRKRFIRGCLLSLALAALLICLLIFLPTLNPSSYFLFSKAKVSFEKGDNQSVIALTESIVNKDPGFLGAYPLAADTYRRIGNVEAAIKLYFDYALASQKKNSSKDLAAAYTGIAWTYHLFGEYDKAFEFYNKAIDLSRQRQDKLSEAAALEKLAVWHIDRQEFDRALELLTKSSEINRQKPNSFEHRYNLACDYFDLGIIFTEKSDLKTAEEFYRKSKNIFETLQLRHELSDCYFNIGEIYLFEKEYQKALSFYNKGLEIDTSQGNILALTSDYYMLGELYLQTKDLTKAEDYLKQSLALAKKCNSLWDMATVYYDLGLLARQKKQYNKADEYLRSVKELYYRMQLPFYKDIEK